MNEKTKTIQLSEATWRALKQASLDRDESIKEIVSKLVEMYL